MMSRVKNSSYIWSHFVTTVRQVNKSWVMFKNFEGKQTQKAKKKWKKKLEEQQQQKQNKKKQRIKHVLGT